MSCDQTTRKHYLIFMKSHLESNEAREGPVEIPPDQGESIVSTSRDVANTHPEAPKTAGRLRIMYIAGPGDVMKTYEYWKEGRDDPSQTAMTYSGQFFDVCRKLGAKALVVCTNRPATIRDGEQFTVFGRINPLQNSSGFAYHFGQWLYAIARIGDSLKFRANVTLTSNDSYLYPTALMSMWGIRVIPTIHCVLWVRNRKPTGFRGLILSLNRLFLRHCATSILSASREISQQIEELTGGKNAPIIEFLPTYREETFRGLPPVPVDRKPFRILFAGRVEVNKGVFDLLKVAERFATSGRRDIAFDICGDGSQLAELRRRAEDLDLGEVFRSHGHCDRPTMREFFGRSHAVIVPTTSNFNEGFNQVVVEGVLSYRPVITSSICPALQYVRRAVVEVPPDDVAAYGDAILRLCDDHAFYEEKRAATLACRAQFFDAGLGWADAFSRALAGTSSQRLIPLNP